MTQAAAVIRTADHAQKVFKDAAARLDKATANMEAGIRLLETELTQPLQARTAHPLSVEVRTYLRGLKSPTDFVRQAIEAGETEVVAASLGSPAFLSGLTPEMHAVLLRLHFEKADPVGAKRLRAMKKALELLGTNGPLLAVELEKAIGAKPHEVKAYREAKARTDKAFAS